MSSTPKIYENDLVFNLTSHKGVFEGFWPATVDTIYPDTVVAVSDDNNSEYNWVIEFQCVENEDHLAKFIGVNFYSRSNLGTAADINYEEMLQKSHELGIDFYWNSTSDGLRRVDHTGCFYE
eukprot:CAMPEP_0170074152 /NCGR_PEP_ID=MMETSP0019_2-20121128/11491_1 /TAXON_ID=98059 /ORGANISM="Dinobryon sp., Strain UTEXLB2267" /LENGTH=121 /DNA_ID=CAMNT_0010284239 /DNA_START=333 /DNA_END=698 /DNA_ORIENTATION=+